MQFTLYAVLLIISTIISIKLVWNSFNRYKERIMFAYLLLMIGIALWSGTYLIEALSSDIGTKIFWGIISVIDQIVPVLFLYFALQFTRVGDKIPVPALILLFIIPLISFILSATYHLHGLIWPEIHTIVTPFAGVSLIYLHGAWYWIEVVYNFLLYITATAVLLMTAVRSPPVYSMQLFLIFLSSLFPFVSSLLYAFALPLFNGIDLTPVSFSITGLIFYYAISRYLLFDLIPIAHEQIFSNMQEGVIVLDTLNRILNINPAVSKMLPVTTDMVGKNMNELSSLFPIINQDSNSKKTSEPRIMESEGRIIEIRSSEINRGSEFSGRLLLCIEVTEREIARKNLAERKQQLEDMNSRLEQEVEERRVAEHGLRMVNKKLNILTGITRHDILNWVMVITGYSSMLEESESDPKVKDRLSKIGIGGEKIREIISFTKVYEEMGTNLPQWIDVERMINEPDFNQFKSFLSIDIRITGLMVYSDLMFSKVFYNLFDNTIRHGSYADKVIISGMAEGEDYCLIYEDNGTGVPENEKRLIFNKGRGKNTGFGLFFIHEILDITGMTIVETGVPGKGVRFEIRIPKAGFRFV